MYREFINFLRIHGVYDRFIKNLNKLEHKSIEEYLKETDSRHFILSSFSWLDTDEGVQFWSNIEALWLYIRIYGKNKK